MLKELSKDSLIKLINAYNLYIENFDYMLINDGCLPVDIFDFLHNKEYYKNYFWRPCNKS